MKNLRQRYERFCLRHRDKGIPNLMLYLSLGSALVYLLNLINGGGILYEVLCFDKAKILQGQVWRLVTYLLTYSLSSNPLLNFIFLYFFYRLGQAVESSVGTFRFNLYYLGGIVLMDVFAMIFCPTTTVNIGEFLVDPEYFSYFYSNMAYYLHLSMILAFATSYPDAQFMLMFLIPVRAWLLALVYLVLIAVDVFNMCYPISLFPHCLFPLIGLLNYFLFFGDKLPNLLPFAWRTKLRKKPAAAAGATRKPIPFQKAAQSSGAKPNMPYTHRCTVCGRTDVSDPELEFRYCSRCKGYYCYCQEHINNHTHME
ncbi:MAG: hypothetical protein IJB17_04015 [Oscillospiraceae bacterium]|nr:hypothetical protein [Oscillospiraceae bacterium]